MSTRPYILALLIIEHNRYLRRRGVLEKQSSLLGAQQCAGTLRDGRQSIETGQHAKESARLKRELLVGQRKPNVKWLWKVLDGERERVSQHVQRQEQARAGPF